MRSRVYLIIPVFFTVCWTVGAVSSVRADDKKQQVERTAAADPHVVLSACVVSGNITVQSWDRNEVSVHASDGLAIELKRIDDPNKSALATELRLVTSERANSRSCLMFGDIRLDVPRAASVRLEASQGDISVTGGARVSAATQSGEITIAHVSEAITANTIGGDIIVQNSSGSIKLHTVGGSVTARAISGKAVDDQVEAASVAGDISLDRVSQPRVKVSTVNGSVSFNGALARGGVYNFQSLSGDVSLFLPAASSFRINATLGKDSDINSDFSLKNSAPPNTEATSRRHGVTQNIEAVVGSGDASIVISSFKGSVQIRKR